MGGVCRAVMRQTHHVPTDVRKALTHRNVSRWISGVRPLPDDRRSDAVLTWTGGLSRSDRDLLETLGVQVNTVFANTDGTLEVFVVRAE